MTIGIHATLKVLDSHNEFSPWDRKLDPLALILFFGTRQTCSGVPQFSGVDEARWQCRF